MGSRPTAGGVVHPPDCDVCAAEAAAEGRRHLPAACGRRPKTDLVHLLRSDQRVRPRWRRVWRRARDERDEGGRLRSQRRHLYDAAQGALRSGRPGRSVSAAAADDHLYAAGEGGPASVQHLPARCSPPHMYTHSATPRPHPVTAAAGCIRVGDLRAARWIWGMLPGWGVVPDHVARINAARLRSQGLFLGELRQMLRDLPQARHAHHALTMTPHTPRAHHAYTAHTLRMHRAFFWGHVVGGCGLERRGSAMTQTAHHASNGFGAHVPSTCSLACGASRAPAQGF
jgi:hypothetical protein